LTDRLCSRKLYEVIEGYPFLPISRAA
jgi:hypothetical protein